MSEPEREVSRHKARGHLGFTKPVLLALCLLLLGFLVCWGLRDKVSLYKQVNHSVPVAKAKILTARERVADDAAQAMPQPPQPATLLVFLCLAVLLRASFRLSAEDRAEESDHSGTHSPPLFEALRRRPPPARIYAFASKVLAGTVAGFRPVSA